MRSQTITQTTTSKCQRRNCFSTKSQFRAILHDETDCVRYSRACRVGLRGHCSHNTVSCQPTVDLPHIRSATCRGVPTIRPVAIRFRVLSVSHRLLTSRRAGRIVSDQRTDSRYPSLTDTYMCDVIGDALTDVTCAIMRPSFRSFITHQHTDPHSTLYCTEPVCVCLSDMELGHWVTGSMGHLGHLLPGRHFDPV